MKIQDIIDKFDSKFRLTISCRCCDSEELSDEIKQFLQEELTLMLEETKKELIKKIKDDLIKVADDGEYEDLRREVERYFKK